MSRRSPRSYISRTFPDAMRGRSETGGMRRRLPGLEDDDGDDAVGLALVVVVGRVAGDEPRPVRRALLVRAAGPSRDGRPEGGERRMVSESSSCELFHVPQQMCSPCNGQNCTIH